MSKKVSRTRTIDYFRANNFLMFLIFSILAVFGHMVLFLVGTIFNIENIAQISIEYLFIVSFTFLMIIAIIRHGYLIILLFAIELFIVVHEETNSLYNLKTYMYTGFNLNLGYQNAIPGRLPAGGYPIAIAFAWIFLIYACYNFTNFLFDRNSPRGVSSWKGIFSRIFFDGMLIWQFSLLVEAVGVDLGWWIYAPKNQPRFLGLAPMDTLYYYLMVTLLFSSMLRIGEKIFKREKVEIEWLNGFSPLIFLYFWIFIILLVLFRFGYYHWAFFVGTPSLFIYFGLYWFTWLKPQLEKQFSSEIS
ncbi:MAG: hypothetical protein ACFFD1_09765 [Candidatus Thorarchaeota archaeon]